MSVAHKILGNDGVLKKTLLGVAVVTLSQSYRAPQALIKFPSDEFYGGRLFSNVKDQSINELFSNNHFFHWFAHSRIQFVDVQGYSERVGFSLLNKSEVEAMLHFASGVTKGTSIGVITPYKAQERLLRQYPMPDNRRRQFQGMEADIIIISLVTEPNSFTLLKNSRKSECDVNKGKTNFSCLRSKKQYKKPYPAWEVVNDC